MSDVIVIGGGAAGMLASAVAASRGLSVVLLEPNKNLGKKLRITGKGRCNITNSCDVQGFIANVPRNGRFMYSSISRFTPADAMAFFEGIGLPLKTERGNRVFPQSDSAADVARALERHMAERGVKVKHLPAKRVISENCVVRSVVTQEGELNCAAAIICTGGVSYPATGSTGDGYKFAREAGHAIVAPHASLVPLVEEEGGICAELMGLSLKNVKLSVFEDDKRIFDDFGEMLFTHFGVSGPIVLSASAHMRRFGEARYRIEIDLKPALDEQTLDKRIISDFGRHKNSDFINSLGGLLPGKLIPAVVRLSGIDPRVKAHSVTREQRLRLASLLKAFPVRISGPRPVSEAVVTSGGVDIKEVDPKTMQSKLVSGLYFAGEVLDVDAYTGGFNLQIAWSTAWAAGNAV